jgi:hypothetical protein
MGKAENGGRKDFHSAKPRRRAAEILRGLFIVDC